MDRKLPLFRTRRFVCVRERERERELHEVHLPLGKHSV